MIVVCHGVIPITEEIDESISKTDTIYRSVNDVTPYKFNDSARREQNQVMLGLCRAEACLRAKHNGKELDAETGLYYYGARYYDPATALWLGVDPLADKYPEVSPYVYCAGNPVVRIDPDGRWVHIVIGAAVGAVVNGAIVAIEGKSGKQIAAAGTAGAMAGAAGDIAEQCINIALGEADEYNVGSTVTGAITGGAFNALGNATKKPIQAAGEKSVSAIKKSLSSEHAYKSAVKEC